MAYRKTVKRQPIDQTTPLTGLTVADKDAAYRSMLGSWCVVIYLFPASIAFTFWVIIKVVGFFGVG